MRKTKEQKGITLIALVITIIVLLILAGVAINLAVDANGLFGKANEAKTEWNNRVDYEQETIQNVLNMANEYIGGNTVGRPTLPAGWDSNKVADTVTENSTVAGVTKERTVPIPTGFTASDIGTEKTIAGGLVIYEGTETVSEDEDALTTRNQYVWIPVDDINSMIMCSKNNTAGKDGETVCNIILQNENLVCDVHDNSTVLVGRLYTSQTSKFDETNQTYDTSYREPADLTNEALGDASSTGFAALKKILNMPDATNYDEIQEAWQNRLKNDFTAMAKSVYTYGGFYISRYEIGRDGASKKDQKILTAATSAPSNDNYLPGTTWWGLYSTLRVPATATNPNSHMIWGCQYDQVIKFIGEEAQTAHQERQETSLHTSGTPTQEGKEEDILNNIYDLEGNGTESTVEATSTSNRLSRGGSAGGALSGKLYSASTRLLSNPTTVSSGTTSRASLYL